MEKNRKDGDGRMRVRVCLKLVYIFIVSGITFSQLIEPVTCLVSLTSLTSLTSSDVSVHLRVPGLVQSGDTVRLTCHFRLTSGQRLYAVQWYREGEEFYRHTPHASPIKQTFRVAGVNVDITSSDVHSVTLRDVVQATSGQFRCEVSLDAPSFDTYYDYGDLIVITGPSTGLMMNTDKDQYHSQEIVRANCSLADTKPVASLNWYINNMQAPPQYLVEYAPVRGRDLLESVTLGLQLPLTPFLTRSGHITLNCTAAVANAYWENRRLHLPVITSNRLQEKQKLSRTAGSWTPGQISSTSGRRSQLLFPIVCCLVFACFH